MSGKGNFSFGEKPVSHPHSALQNGNSGSPPFGFSPKFVWTQTASRLGFEPSPKAPLYIAVFGFSKNFFHMFNSVMVFC
jgi:hypothetical protein